MIGRLKATFCRHQFSDNGMELVFNIPDDHRRAASEIVNEIKSLAASGKSFLNLSIDKYREKRSLDANAYFWTLAGKLAAVLNIRTEDIYRDYIKNVGDNFEIVEVRDDAKERWVRNWVDRGLGWICDDLGAGEKPGHSNMICYFGSRTYDTRQMYCLTQLIVQDCKDQGIETKTPRELEMMMNEWAKKQAGKGV